jgi:hypothetical protein
MLFLRWFVTSYGARLTETDYYLPLKLANSLFLLVLCQGEEKKSMALGENA